MRTRRPSPQQEAASRRLAQLDWWADHTRVSSVPVTERVEPAIRAPAPVSPAPEAPAPEAQAPEPPRAVPVPRPGRHAAPARVGGLAEAVLPESMRGRVSLGAAQLSVVAVIVAVGMGVTAWFVVRSAPEPAGLVAASGESLAPLVPLPGESQTPSTPVGSEPPAPTASESVTVDVAGKVKRPGIAVLDAGSRVIDALEAAGGVKRGVDTASLNLARVLVDGEQIVVGGDPPPAAAAVPDPAAPPGADPAGQLVNLNTATTTELETIPRVGPVTAAAIIAWREQHGGFSAVEQLIEVDGIGEKTLATIAPHVTV